ncbi:Fibronectin type III domain-containing protein [Cohnella sp. OV330]|uniref:fibronectin type III domain-containing protein n=1 Tax=Cohnella sp. OV330 TaxID=1855288 RepID=UPI0008E5DFE2|nr:DUF5060 domain-containing protein [Cohnella sp. OV330]SFB59180.1 Fibronectin type III domain-containing protein [Cohnella sp. OV330]
MPSSTPHHPPLEATRTKRGRKPLPPRAALRLAVALLAFALAWSLSANAVSASPAAPVDFVNAASAVSLAQQVVATPTEIRDVTLNTTAPAQNGKLELAFNLSSAYANPFDPEEVDVRATVRTPDGAVETVPGFYRSDASPSWAVRYSPRQPGLHRITLSATDKNGTAASDAYTFTAGAPASGRGFMNVSGDRFVDGAGSQITLLGSNYAWSTPDEIAGAMQGYEDAGMNIMRVWLSCWWANYSPEYGPVTTTQGGIEMTYKGIGDYNLDNLDRMDQVIASAEDHNLYIMLTLNSFGDFYYDWAYHAYNRANGGTSDWKENDTDFWYNPDAIAYQQRLLRYIFARWGYSTALGMLEYWNESDNRVDTTADIRDSWHRSLDTYWKSWDFYKHPTTTSFAWKDHAEQHATQDSWDGLDTLDVVNEHLYEGSTGIVDIWKSNLDALKPFGNRPVFIGEAGKTGNDTTQDANLLNYAHDGVWAPIFRSGAAGANLWWIFENGFDMPDAYKAQYKHLADFIRPEESRLIGMPFVDLGDQGAAQDLQAGGFAANDRALLWAHDKAAPYDELSPRTMEGGTVTVPGLKPGPYNVTYYNTYTGENIAIVKANANAQGLTLALPAFSRDIAIKAVSHKALAAAPGSRPIPAVVDRKAPSAPANASVSGVSTEDTVKLTWTASTDNVAVAGYDVYRGDRLAGRTYGLATAFKDTLLAPGTSYTYTVRARDAAGNVSAASQAVQATTLTRDVEAPTAPSASHSTGTTFNTAHLSWQASTDDRAVDGYLIYRDGLLVGTTRDTVFQDDDLRPGTTYAYAIKAKDASLNVSAASEALAVTTETPEMSDNLLTNPGFETVASGKPASWLCEQDQYCLSDTAEKRSGDASMIIDASTGAWFGIQSTAAAATPDTDYELQGYLNVSRNDGASVKIRIQFLNAVGSILDDKMVAVYNGTTQGYENVYGVFRSPAHTGKVRVYIYIEGLNAKINLDDFSIRAYGSGGGSEGPGEPAADLLVNGNFDAHNDSWKTAAWTCEKEWLCQWTDQTAAKRTTGDGTAAMKVVTTDAQWFGVYQDALAVAGGVYTLDGYAKVASVEAGKLQAKLVFFDADDNRLSEEWIADLDATSEGFVHIGGSKTAPADTAYVRVLLYANGFKGEASFDDFKLTADGGGATEPEEPAGPSGNLLLNPGFDDHNDAWKTAVWTCEKEWLCQWTDQTKRTGTASMRVVTTDAQWFEVYQDAEAAAGKTYAADGYVKLAAKTAGNVQLKLVFYDATNAPLSEAWIADVDAASDAFVNVHGAKTAPDGTAKVRVRLYMNGLQGDVYFDDFSLVRE